MTPDLSFIHLSDVHMPATHEARVFGYDALARARRVLAAVREIEIKPAFFLITGDLAHRSEAGSYALLNEVLADIRAKFDVPVMFTLGNHDDRSLFRSMVVGEPASEAPYCWVREVSGLRVIGLDAQVTGSTRGYLGDDQLAWLDEQLHTPFAGGTLIAGHHSPLPITPKIFQPHQLVNASALAEVWQPHAHKILGFLFGHIHYAHIGMLGGVLCAAAPGSAFWIDPGAENGLRAMSACGFNLVHVRNGALLVDPIMLPGDNVQLDYETTPFN